MYENKGADQLHSYRTADLRLFSAHAGIFMTQLICNNDAITELKLKVSMSTVSLIFIIIVMLEEITYKPHCEKTGFLHMRK